MDFCEFMKKRQIEKPEEFEPDPDPRYYRWKGLWTQHSITDVERFFIRFLTRPASFLYDRSIEEREKMLERLTIWALKPRPTISFSLTYLTELYRIFQEDDSITEEKFIEELHEADLLADETLKQHREEFMVVQRKGGMLELKSHDELMEFIGYADWQFLGNEYGIW